MWVMTVNGYFSECVPNGLIPSQTPPIWLQIIFTLEQGHTHYIDLFISPFHLPTLPSKAVLQSITEFVLDTLYSLCSVS